MICLANTCMIKDRNLFVCLSKRWSVIFNLPVKQGNAIVREKFLVISTLCSLLFKGRWIRLNGAIVEALSSGIKHWMMAQYAANKLWLQVMLNFRLLYDCFWMQVCSKGQRKNDSALEELSCAKEVWAFTIYQAFSWVFSKILSLSWSGRVSSHFLSPHKPINPAWNSGRCNFLPERKVNKVWAHVTCALFCRWNATNFPYKVQGKWINAPLSGSESKCDIIAPSFEFTVALTRKMYQRSNLSLLR